MSWLTGSATDGEYSIIVTSAVCQYPSHTAGTQCSQCLVSSSQCSTSPPPPTQLYSTHCSTVHTQSYKPSFNYIHDHIQKLCTCNYFFVKNLSLFKKN